mmetsp:Transcript_15593/g.26845  ORF Transcript_15593/g.26845 Transcript_15593/m.26845 type:complete len:369 (-) Transcript_15593:49-1155(-)|eukprot:CAMPEP_0196661876 /NCGR_PEP_ID=MMETSP1086-20130531/46221_1 /TAXON_ID=77921 /ORGANISM="Cyanoptyche  gloeocystis , Strain SAG4.97" /LENGTH=368 /DNA_ID=CAMNT_0041996979 /DNA_START=105 /DNA_END=1211 /DNA_ORIENTATION=-
MGTGSRCDKKCHDDEEPVDWAEADRKYQSGKCSDGEYSAVEQMEVLGLSDVEDPSTEDVDVIVKSHGHKMHMYDLIADGPVKFATNATKYVLHAIHEVPDWVRDNEYILTGYRVHFSFGLCLRSLFRIHNETVNVWSHLLGFFLFLGLTAVTYVYLMPTHGVTWVDRVICLVFLISAQMCLFFSACFHLFYCVSHTTSKIFARLDYSGISLLIAGSFYPIIYYEFRCSPPWSAVYITGISVLGIIVIAVTLIPTFDKPKYRTIRAGLFVAMGLSGIIPVIHWVSIYGVFSDRVAETLYRLLLMGFLYVLGAVFYATRVPERFKPGLFDVWLSSHQVFHLLVVAAALIHYSSVIRLVQRHHATPCLAPH